MVGTTLWYPSLSERMVITENKIRVSSNIVIEVNDEGDTIVVNAEDQLFIEKFYALCDRLEAIRAELNNNEVEEKSEREKLRCMIDKTKEIMAGIDELFGENTCRKVFGEIVPNMYLITEFFDQLTPVIKQYVDKRKKKIDAKYGNGRKGARSKYRTKEQIIQDAMG